MIRQVIVVLLATFSVTSYAENIPLRVLYEIVRGFTHTDFCDHDGVTKYWIDTEGGNVRHITLKAKLKPPIEAREVCDCFIRYLSQKDWLNGAVKKCGSKCGYATLEFIGKPDPTYNPNINNENLDKPLEELRAVFENTQRATPVNLVCSPSCVTADTNKIHCTLTCPINNDPRTKEKICVDLKGYYTENNWLDGATMFCRASNGNIVVNFIGDSSIQLNCNVHHSKD